MANLYKKDQRKEASCHFFSHLIYQYTLSLILKEP